MNNCPSNCSGGNSARQHELTDGQRKRVSTSAREAVSQSKGCTYRCSYCGSVYIRELSGTITLGSLDNGVLGEGWHSKHYA